MTTKQPISAEHTPEAIAAKQRIFAKADPILQELWEIKRQINAEANFDIAQLADRANQFDLQKTLDKLRAVH
jgi:hypothetical protein